MITSSTGVFYWDMYFILKTLPMPMQFVSVDISDGTRQYDLMKMMQYYRHIQLIEQAGFISEVASTASGLKFFAFLVKIGYGTKQTEEYGQQWIDRLEKEFNAKKNNK